MMNDSAYSRFVERYEAGQVPWDDWLPPPEVRALAATLPPGKALDLGCGYGRTAIYLAQNDWQVDGIDFVPQAIIEARKRAVQANVSEAIRFHQASVADLHFLTGRYQLAIDVGCFHALDEEGQRRYHQELLRLLEVGSYYLLFARLRQEEVSDDERPSGVLQTAVESLFANGFERQKTEVGITQADEKTWKSGWFWFVRRGNEDENS